MRVSLSDRRADLDYNLVGTINVLEAMLENKVSDFVFASTSALYGEVCCETHSRGLLWHSDLTLWRSELGGEAFAEAYTQLSEMKMWAFRFGTGTR